MDSSEKVNILLVDDQESRLLSYEAILGDLHENLVRANSGTEALKRLMKDDFALILLDVNMPVLDGFETARMIRQHPRYESTPIIFVTAIHDTELDRRKGYQLGAVDYINIPIIPEILRSKVAVLVELYQKRRELKALNSSLERANQDLALANQTLLAEKTRELTILNDELSRANGGLVQVNNALTAEIKERHRAEEALRNADRCKDEFLALLAHELRNPLAPIRNGVEILRRSTSPDSREVAEGMIERQVRHMTRLVDDLLDVSRITRGRIELRRERLDLLDVIQAGCEATQPIIDAAGQKLLIDTPGEPLPLEGDAARLTQVVANLLNNASKFMDNGKRIWLSAAREGDALLVTVRDEGIGIPEEFRSTIFEMFSQVDRSLERSKGGLGIGLALARSMVELHGGTIAIESEGPGKGSTVTVRLPASESTATSVAEKGADDPARQGAPDPASPGLARAGEPPAGRRILVADDNDDSAESMSLMLELQGHKVFRAVDGVEALETASDVLPEVILLDIGMPRMNGYAAARRIRETCGKDVVLIAVTGFGQSEDLRQAMDAGFDAHLTKPVEMAELRRLIERSGRSAS
jgi:signal transduction histidine kinase